MLLERRQSAIDPIRIGPFLVSGVARETVLGLAGSSGGAFVAYARASHIEVNGDDGVQIIATPDIEFRVMVTLLIATLVAFLMSRRRRL